MVFRLTPSQVDRLFAVIFVDLDHPDTVLPDPHAALERDYIKSKSMTNHESWKIAVPVIGDAGKHHKEKSIHGAYRHLSMYISDRRYWNDFFKWHWVWPAIQYVTRGKDIIPLSITTEKRKARFEKTATEFVDHPRNRLCLELAYLAMHCKHIGKYCDKDQSDRCDIITSTIFNVSRTITLKYLYRFTRKMLDVDGLDNVIRPIIAVLRDVLTSLYAQDGFGAYALRQAHKDFEGELSYIRSNPRDAGMVQAPRLIDFGQAGGGKATKVRCRGTTQNGTRCKNKSSSDYCHMHRRHMPM